MRTFIQYLITAILLLGWGLLSFAFPKVFFVIGLVLLFSASVILLKGIIFGFK